MKKVNDIKQALKANGIVLPQAPEPAGHYWATTLQGKLLFISGQLPFRNGTLIYQGQVGKTLTTEEGHVAAQLCALNILSHINNILEPHKLKQIIKIEGFINCTAFTEHAQVLDGASQLLSKTFLEKAGHVRTVMGCNSLPLGAAVEIAAIAELE